jgi:hypothetical protein
MGGEWRVVEFNYDWVRPIDSWRKITFTPTEQWSKRVNAWLE